MEDITVKTKLGEYLVKSGLLYTETDEWLRKEGDTLIIGVTDYAQKKLKYIVNVELPGTGSEVKKGETLATLESVKSVADVYSPVDCEVLVTNEELLDSPDLVNKDPYGKGWIAKVRIKGGFNEGDYLTPQAYADKIREKET